jgi:hypothetical protein
MKTFRLLLWTQSIYTLLTALWPLIDIESFMFVTGYKTDIWLVKTVGALLIPVAFTLALHLFIDTDPRPAFLLGGLSCIAFICIDFYYSLGDVINDIYMADGFIQILFLITWLYIVMMKYNLSTNSYR